MQNMTNVGYEKCRTGQMQKMTNVEQDKCRTGQMQNRTNVEQDKCRTGQINAGQANRRHDKHKIRQTQD